MGFDWPNVEGLFEKLREETDELREELKEFPAPGPQPQASGVAGSGRVHVPDDLRARLEEEVGDLFFVLVNIARYLSVDPESALKKTNRKVQAPVSVDGGAVARVRTQTRAGKHGRAGIPMAAGERTGKIPNVKTDSIEIRKCEGIDELHAAVELQKEVWNFTDAELVPLRLFVVAEKVGGQVLGAFEGEEMVGFALAVPGVRAGHAYLHSHMLAVRKDYRNGGLGRRIKMYQRDEALERGLRTDRVDVRSAGNQERLSEH